MKCNDIQDLILTDYHDGHASEDIRKQVKSHLKQCAVCREFAADFQRYAVEPLAEHKLPQAEPPESLWNSIRDRIEQENKQQTPTGLLGRLALITHIPRPAYTAIASAIAASLVFFMMTSSPEYSKEAGDYISEQTSYLFSDNGLQQSESETEADDEFDSVIEVFFM
ncbi:MAG: zf-HC2 domain-containing protein [Candidatus Auribacterota bacterium]